MFFRLLMESFLRQRRRKALAGIAILLGTTAVTAMLALATTIGDRIHKELAVYGANIVIYPKADQLDVKVGGVDIKPTTGGAYLKESDLAKLKTIFWANNITGVSPELPVKMAATDGTSLSILGLWFGHPFGSGTTGAPTLHPWWKLNGAWPSSPTEVVAGSRLDKRIGDTITAGGNTFHIVGLLSTGDATENDLLVPLPVAQQLANLPDAIDRVEVSARTKPEDAFARVDPDTLPPKQREIWYCRPYANSIAYQIREAIPGAQAEQVRRVEQSEGTVLARISGLMWLISAAALLAAGFAVSAAMATAVLERRGEIGLMRSLGASKSAIALLFYAETGLLSIVAGTLGYLIGSGLAAWLGARIFSGEAIVLSQILNPVLLPVVVATALLVAIAGCTPSIRTALEMDPSAVLRADA
ncbi:ABC transporter permease [Granulicella arctica]|uniref:Putative ABC transport system permease protein n=1 Tax=Granulicella arctica TaxID=940613 RepID=A0A7Y9PJD5_9BACT|nr:ABC transporter permease [Granulicella arctica]NYF80993.1 putative ABC transport system permease protein [Granulicella arctica]